MKTIKKTRDFSPDKENVEKNRLTLGDLLIPFLAVVAFLILTVFVYIPQVQSAFTYYDDIDALKNDQSKMEKNLAILESLEDGQANLLLDLAAAESVIPNKLSVSDFTFDVDDLAKEHNLVLQSISSSDVTYEDTEELQFSTGAVKGITGPLRYEGTFEDITDFLEEIKLGSAYLIETSEINMRRLDTSNRWAVDLAVTGYYFVENQYEFTDYTQPITDYHKKDAFLEELKSRGKSLISN